MPELTGILLAAGYASRFGDHKLLTLMQGYPLILHGIVALSPCDNIIAVVQDGDRELQACLRDWKISYVLNPDPQRGMGYSIACGVKATARSDGWCILPADMPGVQAATTRQLVQAIHSGDTLAAPFYAERRGHPVAFGKPFYEELISLDGDIGARGIVERHANALERIETQDAGVLVDVDTPADLRLASLHGFREQLS